jgi:dTDP-4-dehydrorhamnose 3,5-epimerase
MTNPPMPNTPTLYTTEIFRDHRGTIASFNTLDLSPFKRTYFITHPSTETIRAWQGHKYESKLFKVIKGKFIVGFVEIDNFDQPSDKLKAEYMILTAAKNEFLFILKAMPTG